MIIVKEEKRKMLKRITCFPMRNPTHTQVKIQVLLIGRKKEAITMMNQVQWTQFS